MSKMQPKQTIKENAYTRRLYDGIGILLSVVILAGAFILWRNYDEGGLELNEIGDYLSGIVSALALVWLVLGYRLQRNELSLQLAELKDSTETQKEQKNALQEQARVLTITANALLEHTRPYITASIQWDGHRLVLHVRNDGIRSAENVTLAFEPALDEITDERLDPSTILTHGTIPPGTGYSESLAHGLTLFFKKERIDFETNVSISYSDEQGKSFSHAYPLTVHAFARNIAQMRSERSSMHDITESLGDPRVGSYDPIRKSLHSIAISLGKMTKKGDGD